MSRNPLPEVDLPRPQPLGGVDRPRLRSTAAALTALTAMAATGLVAGPASATRTGAACALERRPVHHSEGLDSWNPAYARPTRTLHAVMVFLSFPDATPLTTPRQLAADYFPATTRFYERASYGKFRLVPHPQTRWIEMPHASTSYEIRRDWDAEHRAAYLRDALRVADPHTDFSKYDIVYFVADPDAPGVDSDATKVVNFDRPMRADGTDIRRVVTVFERHPPDRDVLAHETGHVFDLPDLYHRPTDGKGDWDTYVGDWDVMGSQFGLAPDFFAWHKWKLGWLDSSQVVCVTRGVTRVTLEPLSGVPQGSGAPFGRVGGAKLAVVRTGRDSVLALEARGGAGNDTTTCRKGILAYHVHSDSASGHGPIEVVDTHPHTGACYGESVYPPLADAPLKVGETYTIPGDGVRVAVTGRTPSGAWSVTVTTGVGD
ncbi:M6 family metalloprotease domain-containing protein [Streptomyces beihaiensis]|uniref:M6 family metalloprotease domain-containing protein n=1 Tax=Streptomyces beihaiensis TaxID=2984495 RepID=A0ABT3U303_9ACTN|nr:M6 family metalloprotease domain-containing protein [Streptomyces beihaiensis]MCX3063692.1 M6 family metalloprotease domain-containing protein [Streptomyces beihaiensis]